ncbi:MAG TPA: hypothetical protein VNA24_22380 [Hyalangium sp.]|nr:hypothetical protein [Hyalangium sp.]
MSRAKTREDFGFVLAFDVGYARMATALVHSLNHFHPGRPIRVYVMEEDLAPLQRWAKGFRDVEVRRYEQAGRLSFGEWHPLVWAKLEAFAAEEHSSQVVLDVDQILYRDLSPCIAEALAAGKTISASPDISSLRGHVLPSFTGEPLEGLERVSCFNAGAMIIRPSRDVYRELVDLAQRHHAQVRLPEQAILNLWARRNGGHHDLGEKFMIQPWSPRVLEADSPSCLIHFWTPRPAFFGPSPLRTTEPSLEECMSTFERETGHRYPLDRFEQDFMVRLNNSLEARP